jgi:hypothetical protein
MFKEELYEVVQGAISQEMCTHLDLEFELLRKLTYLASGKTEDEAFAFSDQQVANSFCHYSALCYEALSLQLRPKIEEVTGKLLYPTYTYARIYYRGATMDRHTDRPSCEYSATINISIDPEPWEIWFENLKGEHKAIYLNPGDMIVYKGDTLPHWRTEYKGNRQNQAFLHYVDKKGKYRDYKYDHRIFLGLPKSGGGM